MTHRLLYSTAALASMTLLAASAQAQLGGTVPTAPSAASGAVKDALLLDRTVRVRSWTDEGGTAIHEYASSDGLIFAYTWQGPTMPDLEHLLGKYTESYRAKANARPASSGGLHASRIAQPDVVVDSGGQMRSYVGRAWLPAALPPGVSPADLR
jgi:hypothetical protein